MRGQEIALVKETFKQIKELRSRWKFLPQKLETPTTFKGGYNYTFICSEK